MRNNLNDILTIFLVCLFIGIGRSLVVQDIDLIKTASKITEEAPDRMTEPVFIGVVLAEKLFNEKAIFIDARDKDIYSEGHIKGAINIPWESSNNNNIDKSLIDIQYDESIIIYCSGGDCTLSIDLGEYIFNELSYERVFIFEGGYPSWINKELPIKRICQIPDSKEFEEEDCIYVK